ncbi:MAG: TIGR03790 family protein [Planctomycetes bacterium]|nr:TIGR03790 family protein [Planctomycetota bacterium]
MLAVLLLLVPQAAAPNPDAARVLVVVNVDSPAAVEIAADYCSRRGVGERLEVHCPDSALDAARETISYAQFAGAVEMPLRAALAARPQIDFVVLTKGIPIRLTGAPGLGMDGKQPSVDSWIAAFGYEKLATAQRVALHDTDFHGNAYVNRFWKSTRPFSHRDFGGYLVTRLDGYTVADAKALVTRSLAAEARKPEGEILLDACAGFGFESADAQPVSIPPGVEKVEELSTASFNTDLVEAATLLEKRGQRVRLDKKSRFVGSNEPLAGYASWGSNDLQYAVDRYHELRFVPGALVETAVSTSARTFLATKGGQSLIADLLAQGATGAKGYCDEPLVQAVASPTILFERYLRGWTLAESYYAASRLVGWEDIVIGDPICRPYRK